MRVAPAPGRPCVRCGRHPRQGATYLCMPCHVDPIARMEVATAFEAVRDGLIVADPRRAVVELFHWAGEWGPDR